MQPRIRAVLTFLGQCVVTVLAVALGIALLTLYLSLPVFLAVAKEPMHPIATGLGLTVFGLVWFIVALFAVDASASIYGFRRPTLSDGYLGIRLGTPLFRKPVAAIGAVVVSYLLTLYAFAVIDAAISTRDAGAFKPPLTFASALYFSVVTAATVGYGDIVPVSAAARMAVVAEILLSFGYVSMLFSVIAGLAWQDRKRGVSD